MYKLKLRDELRRAWLFVLCACALTALQACGGSSGEKTVKTYAQGFVSTSAPMVNTTVNFYAAANKSGPQVEGSPIGIGTSNVNGLFVASIFLPSQVLDSNNWPTAPVNFRVTASGGTMNGSPVMGVLRADVRNYQSGQAVYVNALTTLVAAYWDATPGITLADAETAVGKYLGLPAAALGSAYVPYDAASFSQVTFEKQVATQLTLNGSQTNINTYIAGLLVEMKANPTATHRFVAAPSVPATSGCNAVAAQVSESPKVTANACASLTTGSASTGGLDIIKQLALKLSKGAAEHFLPPGQVKDNAGSILDFVFSFIPGDKAPPDRSPEAALAMQKKLDEIQGELILIRANLKNMTDVMEDIYVATVEDKYIKLFDLYRKDMVRIDTVLDAAFQVYGWTKEIEESRPEKSVLIEMKINFEKAIMDLLPEGSTLEGEMQMAIAGAGGTPGVIHLAYDIATVNRLFYNSAMDEKYASILYYWQYKQVMLYGIVLAKAKMDGLAQYQVNHIINTYQGNLGADGMVKNLPAAAGTNFGLQDAKTPKRLPAGTLYSKNSKLLIKDSTFQPESNAYKYLYVTPGAGKQAGEDSDLFTETKKLAVDGWRLPTPDEATSIFNGWNGASPAAWAIAKGWPKMNMFLYKSTPKVQPYTDLSFPFRMATTETLKQLNSHVNFVSGRSFNMGTGQFDTTSSWMDIRLEKRAGFTRHTTSSTDKGYWDALRNSHDTRYEARDGNYVVFLQIGVDPDNRDPGTCSLTKGWWGFPGARIWNTRETPCDVVTEYNNSYVSDIVNLIPVRSPAAGEFYEPRK
jgi:hypothetical protein